MLLVRISAMLKTNNLLPAADVRLILGRSQKKSAAVRRIAGQNIIFAP
jgi:hypothetical protein